MMVSQIAARGLSQPLAASQVSRGDLSVLIALPAARLLLADDASQHPDLITAMRTLADLGRPWLNIGVNVGALAAQADIEASRDARAAIDALLRRHDGGDGHRAVAPPLPGKPVFPVALADGAGHTRDIYHPLAVHLCLAAFHRHYESVAPALWAAAEQALLEMVAPLRLVEHFTDARPPAALVPLILWQALGLAEQAALLSRDIDLEMVDSAVQAIVDDDGEGNGALHGLSETDSLDTWTYRELVGLHALAALALKRRNGAWAKRVEQVALFHLENTQPDNATNQPWGVFAFLWPVKTRSFAEQQLHDATAHAGGTVDPLAAMLLADAADCLAEFGG
jgi:hypothetical protein